MMCNHPECVQKRKNWNNGMKYAELGQQELEELFENGIKLYWSNHITEREIKRGIKSSEVEEVLKIGECITRHEYFDTVHGKTIDWIVLGWSKVAKGKYQPLHINIKYNPEKPNSLLKIVTVYSPADRPWAYENNYSVKICWKEKM